MIRAGIGINLKEFHFLHDIFILGHSTCIAIDGKRIVKRHLELKNQDILKEMMP